MQDIYHAPVLNMHQPASNLDDLLVTQAWEAKEILFAYDRMPRALWGYEDIARVHLALSGTLLETLSSPAFQSRVYAVWSIAARCSGTCKTSSFSRFWAPPTITRCWL